VAGFAPAVGAGVAGFCPAGVGAVAGFCVVVGVGAGFCVAVAVCAETSGPVDEPSRLKMVSTAMRDRVRARRAWNINISVVLESQDTPPVRSAYYADRPGRPRKPNASG
jgi:hypothetical protein